MKTYIFSIAVFSLLVFTPLEAFSKQPGAASYDTEAVSSEDDLLIEVLVPAENEPPAEEEVQAEKEDLFDEELEEEVPEIADPIEPINRMMFHINDKLYFWVLKPVAWGYAFVVPERARVGVRRFFSNVTTPIRLANDLLQFKFEHAGTELSRFVINSTVGVLGFTDPARDRWGLFKHEEDFGQTLGFYGSGPGFYINWPILGPSSLRDTVGLAGDFLLNPISYLFPNNPELAYGLYAYRRVNETSLTIGDYEAIKEELEPYIFLRNAYHQHRENAVKE